MSFTVFLGNLPVWVTADDIQSWLNSENMVADSIKVDLPKASTGDQTQTSTISLMVYANVPGRICSSNTISFVILSFEYGL